MYVHEWAFATAWGDGDLPFYGLAFEFFGKEIVKIWLRSLCGRGVRRSLATVSMCGGGGYKLRSCGIALCAGGLPPALAVECSAGVRDSCGGANISCPAHRSLGEATSCA